MTDAQRARAILDEGGYSVVMCRGNDVYTCSDRGVRPLLELLASERELSGYAAADLIVGRAAAFLYLLIGVRSVYGRVMSRGALELLRERGIPAEYGTLTEYIINRRGDGMCPMEEAVQNISDPAEAESAVRTRLAELSRRLPHVM